MSDESRPALFRALLAALAPLRAAAMSEDFVRKVTRGLGWDLEAAGVDVPTFVASLREMALAFDEIAKFGGEPPTDLGGYTELLDAAERVFDGLRAIQNLAHAAGGTQLDDLGGDLLDAFVIGAWFRFAPTSFAIASLLTLIEEIPPAPEIRAGDRVVRRARPRAKLRFDRLGALIRDPVARLREHYFGAEGLADRAAAFRAADQLFPRLAFLFGRLGLGVAYGLPPGAPLDTDDRTREDLAHALTIYGSVDDGEFFGATFSLSAERGVRGLLVRPFGQMTYARTIGTWRIAVETAATLGGMLFGDEIRLRGGDTLGVKLAAEPAADDFATSLGGSGGTAVQIGKLRVESALGISAHGVDASLELLAERVRVQIAPSDGDGFLAAILPRDGLHGEVDLGIGWSSARGVHFRGSASLEGTWPSHKPIGPLTLEALRLGVAANEAGVRLSAGLALALRLGPLGVLVDGVGVAAAFGFPPGRGNLGVAQLDLAFQPPDGVGLSLELATVRGAGRLKFGPGRYVGTFSLEVADVLRLDLFGLLDTTGRGFSLLLAGVASFPGVPIGFGFELRRAGAVVGVNRRLDSRALVAALQTGGLAGLLTPPRADASPSSLAAQLGALFPRADGAYVGGVVLGVAWGHPTVATIDVAFLYDSSAPGQLTMVGTMAMLLPENHPLVKIHVDLAGVFRASPLWIDLRASLRESSLAGMTLTGDAALQLGLGESPRFVFSLGGFHSGFTPPDDFPKLRRLELALPANEHVELSLQGFFAVTSNSLQFGAFLHLWAGIEGVLSIEGDASFEAIVSWRPVHFEAALDVRVAVKARNTTLLGAELRGKLSGPGPWHVEGGVYITVLGYDVEVYSVNKSFGSDEAPAPVPPIDLVAEMEVALRSTRNWRALPVGAPAISLRGDVEVGTRILVHPLGALEFTQSVAPLGSRIDRVGSARPAAERTLTIGNAMLGTVGASHRSIDGFFAPAQFFDLTDDQKLSSPSFEAMPAGVRIEATSGGPDPTTFAVRAALGYETIPAPPVPVRHVPSAAVLDAELAGVALDRWQAPAKPARVTPVRYAIASTETMMHDASLTPPGGFTSRALAQRALNEAVTADPSRIGLLQILGRAA